MRTLTYVTELGVGVACVVGAVAAGRTARLRWLAVVLAVAGVAAVAHAVVKLTA